MENVNKLSKAIKNWASDDRPREKMILKGADSLSNAELLAIIINNGTKDRSALELAKNLLALQNNNLDELGKLSITDIQQIKGIGIAKAVSISAALEIGRRRHGSEKMEKKSVKSSSDIANFLKVRLKDYAYEVFAVVFLNQANRVNNMQVISRGGITGTVADPRVILKHALEHKATSIVLCHNHPSGNLMPSQADKDITQKIKQAASYMDIRVLDHIIVSDEGYYSFADEGLL